MTLSATPPRRRTPRWAVAFAAALVTIITALPTAARPAQADGEQQDTLTFAISQDVDSLSPFLAQRTVTTTIHRLIYDFLTNYDPETNEPIGALAESWEASEDKLTWTYQIREGLTWSDGEPITAEDIEWTYTTMMEDEAAGTANGNFVANFEKVTATEKHTLEIKLKKPQATMLALDIPVLPKHIWKDIGDFSTFNNDEEFPIVGSGPFILTEYDPNQSITLEANPDYWRGVPEFERIVFRYYQDQDAMVEALKAGEVSLVSGLTPAQAEALKNEPDITVNEASAKRFSGFTINPGAEAKNGEKIGDGHPALRDQTVRQAIMHAIDKEAIVESVYGGYAEPAEGYIPKRYDTYYWKPEGDTRIEFDPERANRMLDEAGYEMGDDGVRVSPEGERLTFRMFVHNDNPQRVQTGKLMEEWLADIGVEIEGHYVDPAQIGDTLKSGEFDLIFTGWTVNPDPDYVLGIHTCDALPPEPGAPMRSDAFFCNEKYDKLYEQQISEYNPQRRAEIVKEMQQVLYETAVVNVLVYPDMLEAYRSDQIASIQVQPSPGGNIWRQDGYWAFFSAKPAEGESAGGGLPTMAVAGIAAAVLVVLAGGAYLVWRRRSATAGDRE